MYGPGPLLPPPPGLARRIAVVVLRIVLALVPPATLGILGWVPLLRLALLRRRVRDWLGCAGMAVLCTAAFVLTGYTSDENDWQTNTGGAVLLLLAAFNPVYFVIADVRWHRKRAAWPGHLPAPASGRPYPMVLPRPGVPLYPGAEQFLGPRPADPALLGQAPYPAPPPPAPHLTSVPAPEGRLDRVRAELDELSAYLRAQEER